MSQHGMPARNKKPDIGTGYHGDRFLNPFRIGTRYL